MSHAEKAAEALVQKLGRLSLTLALAESCTAGLISGLLAKTPGASRVLWGSFVCYTPEAKVSMLGIDRNKIMEYGLVSAETASFMAAGALEKSGADIAASVTGLAGPEGDGSDVPIGTVWAALAAREGAAVRGLETGNEFHFDGDRNTVRLRAAIAALELIESALT